MQKTRILLLVTILWFLFVFNVGRLNLPFGFEPVTYFSITISFVLLTLIPLRRRGLAYTVILAVILLNFLLKSSQGVGIRGPNWVLSAFDIFALAFTGYLGLQMRLISQSLSTFSGNKYDSAMAPDFEIGQSQIYREIRRARRYQRSAALLSIFVGDKSKHPRQGISVKVNGHNAIDVNRRLAELFVKALRDYDVVTFRDSHIIILLPETNRDSACETIRRLKSLAADELGVELNVGLATFPDEAVTFESMLEIAEAKAKDVFALPTSRERKSTSVSTNSLLQS